MTTDRHGLREVLHGDGSYAHGGAGIVVGHHGGTQQLLIAARREADVQDDAVVDG